MTTWNEHKAMLTALEHGTATPGQQRAARAFIDETLRQHAKEIRETERDARDAYHEGRANERAEQRGEPPGTY